VTVSETFPEKFSKDGVFRKSYQENPKYRSFFLRKSGQNVKFSGKGLKFLTSICRDFKIGEHA
jgi:hypothetical protein